MEGCRYARRVRLAHGVASLRLDVRDDGVDIGFDADPRDVPDLLARVRALLDLDADAPRIDAALAADPLLAPSVAAHPGIRAPGVLDEAELLARAIVGQQVSLAAARTVLGRLARAHGAGGCFPAPAELAAADPSTLPMPRARGRALTVAMAALAGDPLLLRDRERLLSLPGIGPWTADYIALRLGDPDAFLPGDLVARRALAALGAEPDRPERWRPYRAYALHRLWMV
jgi:AraC family transcriptional regulator of adaptative response / DNA-3-methyladenine glycosylase II